MSNKTTLFRRILSCVLIVMVVMISVIGTMPSQVYAMDDVTLKDTTPKTTSKIQRIYGDTRYITAIRVADALKKQLNVKQFETIIVATGWDYADALSGGYLATINKAPILLVSNGDDTVVLNYIKKNLVLGGKIYILGGEKAVSGETESALRNISLNTVRLAGKTRYETNLKILREADVTNQDLLICSGANFPDAISAVSTGRPVLLVKKPLANGQKKFIEDVLPTLKKIYVIGGPMAVSVDVEKEISQYKTTSRIFGDTRYETSREIAKRFFPSASEVVMATGSNFPDGLTGGVLASELSAPLLLTDNSPGFIHAYEYMYKNLRIKKATILGGAKIVSNDTTSITEAGAKKCNLLKIGSDLYFAHQNGTVAKSKFLDYEGKRYYATTTGRLAKDEIVQVKNKYYGAQSDGSLAKNGWVKTGRLTYYFKNYEIDSVCIKAKKVLDKIGYSLWEAYLWSAEMRFFRFNYNIKWGIRWYADFGFTKGYGDCIVMGSTFYVMAKMLGEKVTQVYGEVNIWRLPHSWVYIDHPDGRFLYDPNCLNEVDSVTFRVKDNDSNNAWTYHPGYTFMQYEPTT